MITLFGATGFTGEKIARALAREGLSFRIAGRSAEKLRRLSESLPNRPEWLTADATQPATIPPLFENTRMLINIAGPFTDLGERVISQSALAGVHYLDVTNELGYVFRTRTYDEMARKTGAALVPACGFEVSLADCMAALVTRTLLPSLPPSHSANPLGQRAERPIDEVNVVYALEGQGTSSGTRQSAVRSLATSWVAYRDGVWTGQVPGGAVRRFSLPNGERHALSFPSSESVTLPAHVPTQRIDAWMTTTPGARFWAPVLVPLFAKLSRSILRGLFLRVAAYGGMKKRPESTDMRASAPFTIYVSARKGDQTRWMTLEGTDPYGLTAEIVTYAAQQMTAGGFSRSGLLAPAMVMDAQAFLDHAKQEWGATLRTG